MRNSIGVLGVVLLTAAAANAQFPQYQSQGGFRQARPAPRPVVSPYLNLLNGNVSPAVTYQGIIRPQMEAATLFDQQQRDLSRLNSQVGSYGGSGQRTLREQDELEDRRRIVETGHATSFFNRGTYYPRFRGSSSLGAAGGGATRTTAPRPGAGF